MEKDIIIQEDNYTGTINEQYKKIGQEIDAVMAEYVKILRDLTSDGMQGDTATALSDFADEIERLLENMMEPITTDCAGKQLDFILDIELNEQ